jgi:DNA-binding XRE family transcriptional regulator
VDFVKLGQKVKTCRVELNISQMQAAKKLSNKKLICEQSTISRIEAGKYTGKFLLLYLEYLVKEANKQNRDKDFNFNALLGD